MGCMWATPQCLPLPSAPVYPRLWHCMSGDSGSPHKQKARAQASGLELLHLPREVSLPFMSQLKFSSHAIHSVNDKRSRDNLATPDTNNTVTVRDRSSWTLIVGDGLLPALSVYCRQFFPSFVLGRCIRGNSCVRFQWFSLPASDWQMTLSFCFLFKGHPPAENACCTAKDSMHMRCSCFVCISRAVTSDLLHSTHKLWQVHYHCLNYWNQSLRLWSMDFSHSPLLSLSHTSLFVNYETENGIGRITNRLSNRFILRELSFFLSPFIQKTGKMFSSPWKKSHCLWQNFLGYRYLQ